MRSLQSLVAAIAVLTCLSTPAVAAGVLYVDDFSDATLNPFWETRIEDPGFSIIQNSGMLTIDSPTAPSAHLNASIDSVGRYGGTDFAVSVDYRVPQGNAMAWLTIGQDPGVGNPETFGMYLFGFQDYRRWLDNATNFGGQVVQANFGNERTVWHNFKISYDASAQSASAFIDNVMVSTESVNLDNSFIRLNMKDSSVYGPGPSQVQFDNFHLSAVSAVPEPSSAVALLGCLVVEFVRRRRRR